MKRLSKKHRQWLLITVALLFVAGPYLFSRAISPWRQLSVHRTSGISEPQTPERAQLRIACYNIAHGRGLAESNWDGGTRDERLARLDEIAELLRKIDADVCVLNEVDFDSSWSHGVNQAEYLAQNAGYPYRVEQRNFDFRILFHKWRFGNAILSKYPVTNASIVDMPAFASWEALFAGKKQGVVCDMHVGGLSVRVVGAHLSHRSETVRADSAELISNLAQESSLPVIVAGDFNSAPAGFPECIRDPYGRNAMETFDNSAIFERFPVDTPTTSDTLTYHSADPSCVIDWLLIPRKWKFLDYTVEPSNLSDHRPVYADVMLTFSD